MRSGQWSYTIIALSLNLFSVKIHRE